MTKNPTKEINIIAIGMKAALQFQKLGFLSILRNCLRLSYFLLFNLKDFLRFAKVIMLPNIRRFAWEHPKIFLNFLSKQYIALSLNTKSRLALLINHYTFISKFMNDDFTRKLSDREIVIWNKTLETNSFSIRLTYPHYDYEGNLSLILYINSIMIYHLQFTIVPGQIFNMPDDHILYVTRVQGGGNRFDLIKCATKSLNEISPPALLFIAVRAIATALNIVSIAGITVEDHPYLGRLPAADHYFTNYDKFWASIGGNKINNNVYILQTKPDEKPLSDIKQSHRRRTKIKRQIQIDIMGQICQTFEQHCLRAKL